MRILKEEKAQGSTETLLVLSLAVVAAVTVGYFVKNFIANQVAAEIEENVE